MCFSLKRRESMIIVDPFVICRRGGCIWIRSKLSECDMCSMRQGHRATGQTSSFHTHFCYISMFSKKLDFIVRKKYWRNWEWNFVTKWHKVTIFGRIWRCFLDPPASLQGKFIQGVNSITSRAHQGTLPLCLLTNHFVPKTITIYSHPDLSSLVKILFKSSTRE